MTDGRRPHDDLSAIAERVMAEHGFAPHIPERLEHEASVAARGPGRSGTDGLEDLRGLLWSSIDNQTSRDLDQLEVAEALEDGRTRLRIAVADVDAFVPQGSPIDAFASEQTTTVYTGVRVFPMLPEPLSTDATSLLEGPDKRALVIELLVNAGGVVDSSRVTAALVRNRAQLAYDSVGAWLDAAGPPPPEVAQSPALDAQLRLQDRVAAAMRRARYNHGALNIQTIETRPVLHQNQVVDLAVQEKNRATSLIEDFMIAANGAVARLLEAHGLSSIRRVVHSPKRWDRIVTLAAGVGVTLPVVADSSALNAFLLERQRADPDHFADLSLAVIKLMGPGEYVLIRPGDAEPGHFGLAVEDYTHSTAPNRRFADLVTQRLLKAMLHRGPAPYSDAALASIAVTCNQKASAARKVEREMAKRIAAVAMSRRIGDHFEAIVTGVNDRGTFVRTLRPHVEGMLVGGRDGVDVGDRLSVTLARTDVERGFIDFVRRAPASSAPAGIATR